jgi:MoxR-like ATPase
MKVDVVYPSAPEELVILQRMSTHAPRADAVLDVEQVLALQAATDRVFVHHAVAQYAVDLVMATREPQQVGLGPLREAIEYGVSPRATLALVAAARALALLRNRDYVLPHDVADVAGDVLSHRLLLTFDAVAEEVQPRRIIDDLLQAVARPQVAPAQEDEFQEGAA